MLIFPDYLNDDMPLYFGQFHCFCAPIIDIKRIVSWFMGNPNHIDEATIGEIRIPDINIFDRVHKSFPV